MLEQPFGIQLTLPLAHQLAHHFGLHFEFRARSGFGVRSGLLVFLFGLMRMHRRPFPHYRLAWFVSLVGIVGLEGLVRQADFGSPVIRVNPP